MKVSRLPEPHAQLAGETTDGGWEALPQLADVDPKRAERGVEQGQPGQQSRPGPARSGRDDQPGICDAKSPRLFVDLGCGAHIAQAAQPRMPSDRDEVVRPNPGRATKRASRIAVSTVMPPLSTANGYEMQLRAQEVVQQQVAGRPSRAALEVEKMRLHPHSSRRRRGEPGMVRLQPAERHHPVCPPRLGVGQQILQLARLVAAQPRPDLVVALDVDRPDPMRGSIGAGTPAASGTQPVAREDRR